nr:DUF6065 family protein [Sphingomonas carotinifaciens]
MTCYVHPSWAPRLRPATPKRDWMDATPESFAYRCLPLAIANAHGWEIGSPCGFRARWNGGKGADAVELQFDTDASAHHRPVSLFGAGTITFHVEGLFRTSPGWNLWVGGPPNAAKHGLAPLAGVIETDWSPYTFTMNWRFTRAREWVRFEEDEPFCFLFPVQRGVLDEVRPVIRPLADAPELDSAFSQWSASRDAFQEHVRRTQPTAPADKWQKLYYRGVDPNGEPGAADHESKLRLSSFASQDTVPRCPVRGKAAKPMPASPLLAERKPAPRMPLYAGPALDADVMAMTLRNIGFEASRAAPPQQTLPGLPTRLLVSQHATMPMGPAATQAGMRSTARQAWLARVDERQRALSPAPRSIPRLSAPSPEAFLDLFYATGRPVVLEGLAASWPAARDWTSQRLAERIGNTPITFQGGRNAASDFELAKDRHTQMMPFDRYIAEVTSGDGGNDAYITAYNSEANQKAFAPLQRDVGWIPYLTGRPGMLWIGPAGTFTPLHHDLTNNLLVQIVGTKRLHLLPPGETDKLANTRHVFSDVHDIEDPAAIRRFPMAASAQRMVVDLAPGDALFIPVGWWHQVRSLSFSVMLTYTDFVWPNDAYSDFPVNAEA